MGCGSSKPESVATDHKQQEAGGKGQNERQEQKKQKEEKKTPRKPEETEHTTEQTADDLLKMFEAQRQEAFAEEESGPGEQEGPVVDEHAELMKQFEKEREEAFLARVPSFGVDPAVIEQGMSASENQHVKEGSAGAEVKAEGERGAEPPNEEEMTMQDYVRQAEEEELRRQEEEHQQWQHLHEPMLVRILSVNDVYELDNLPHLATAVKAKQHGARTIFVLPGDFLAPSLLSSLDNGMGMVECLNACGVELVCFGNHETDVPHPELISRILQSSFRWVNSNMTDIQLGKGADRTSEFEIIEVESGGKRRRIAFLGLLTEDKALYRPGAFNNASIEPVEEVAERLLKRLYEEEEVDLVVPLTHQVVGKDRELARKMGSRQTLSSM
ncbi:hypothetical protein GUITHDRAFT_136136 [Guillardia theta CCMP2712]|uniref:Calcineurin-like phosphoesterase domain-containing protein n=1 Tax=Guillardia theta (strain CCMP2712) TaxID=905079 RepID=L1JMQ2_GUITC|nr:hypothetical protein GUITHDRAFT_136136 [Guillardia theta CCMP2712]EKX49475.1 hypothetical protein GUITHDRAFT_136136 [Guillardia theta CCMP2712]|eukprot:XP_005836455.1 hypothetical protein GUITHDRAFT_136136 [Guillardia theta CCMP2712]